MPTTLPGMLSSAAALLACGYALARGRTPERAAGGIILAATLVNVMVQDRVYWADPQRRQLALDFVLMLFFAVLVSTSQRKWLIPATAAQLLSCVVRFVIPFQPRVHALALLTFENMLAYVLLGALAYGTYQVASDDHRAVASEARAEAASLEQLYGVDLAYEAASRHRAQAKGRRRLVLEAVLSALDACRAPTEGDTATRWLRSSGGKAGPPASPEGPAGGR